MAARKSRPVSAETGATPTTDQALGWSEEGVDAGRSDGFRDFDPAEFAAEMEAALADPVPIDLAAELAAEDPEPEEEPEYNRLDQINAQDPYAMLVTSHPEMVDSIVSFNEENPADFLVEDRFHAALTRWRPPPKRPESPVLDEDELRPVLPLDAGIEFEGELRPKVAGDSGPQFEGELRPKLDAAERPRPEPLPSEPEDPWDAPSRPFTTAEEEPETAGTALWSKAAVAATPRHLAVGALALPTDLQGERLTLHVAKPFDEAALNRLREETGLELEILPAPIQIVVEGLREAYRDTDDYDERMSLLEGAGERQIPWWRRATDRWMGRKRA